MDHVKPSLVHDFFYIQSIKMIPFHKFKEVIPNVQYKKCENKIKKTWYSFMREAFFEFMYKVILAPFSRIVAYDFEPNFFL
jgi:hypothetical protein